jgi:hypothetical protein
MVLRKWARPERSAAGFHFSGAASRFGPLRTTLAHQAHHLDLDFYDKFYRPGAYTETQKNHHHRWHGGQ